jgi:two-component system, LuxR family, sensor histidine kinase DctS
MIEQVLLNLTRNAVDAMKAIPVPQRQMVIDIRAHEVGGAVKTRFTVIDQGPGVPDAVGQQIFSAFFSTKSDGMGMGLAICRSVVEAAHGSLWFENRTAENQKSEDSSGCQFIMELPAHDAN